MIFGYLMWASPRRPSEEVATFQTEKEFFESTREKYNNQAKVDGVSAMPLLRLDRAHLELPDADTTVKTGGRDLREVSSSS